MTILATHQGSTVQLSRFTPAAAAAYSEGSLRPYAQVAPHIFLLLGEGETIKDILEHPRTALDELAELLGAYLCQQDLVLLRRFYDYRLPLLMGMEQRETYVVLVEDALVEACYDALGKQAERKMATRTLRPYPGQALVQASERNQRLTEVVALENELRKLISVKAYKPASVQAWHEARW